MTNSSPSSALKLLGFASLLLLAGCGCSSDPSPDSPEAVRDEPRPDDVPVIQASAQEAYAKGDWQAATKAYSRLAFDETLPLAVQSVGWTGKGIVDYRRMGEDGAPPELRDTARASFLHAVRLDRMNPVPRYHLGLLYRNEFGFNQAALEQFQVYAALKKNDVEDIHVARALSHIAELKAEIAREQSARKGADRRNPSACASALQRGDAAFRKRQYKTARFAYDAALKADPLSYDAAERLGQCWERTDRTKYGMEQAYECYKQASSLRTYAKTLVAAAELAVKLDKRASAVALYSRAVAASPTDKTAIDGLIRALRKTGDAKSATAYQRYRDGLPRGR